MDDNDYSDCRKPKNFGRSHEPNTVSQLILYAVKHKEVFGFPPAAVFANPELLADAEEFLGFVRSIIEDPESLAYSIDYIYGVRILKKEE